MSLTLKMKEETLAYVSQRYFGSTQVERVVLEFIGQNSIRGTSSSTRDICDHLERQQIATTPGAIRGTILRIRHKLLRYREENRQIPFHLILPERTSRGGYLLKFEKNPYHRSVGDVSADDPWLIMNWKELRKRGYRGIWRGLSLPDGGQGPVALFVWLQSICDEIGAEKCVCLINSTASSKHGIGVLEGELRDNLLHMEGKWWVDYREQGLRDFKMHARLWPFRRHESDQVCISGRFTLSHSDLGVYQEGQLELEYCPLETLPAEEIVRMFFGSAANA